MRRNYAFPDKLFYKNTGVPAHSAPLRAPSGCSGFRFRSILPLLAVASERAPRALRIPNAQCHPSHESPFRYRKQHRNSIEFGLAYNNIIRIPIGEYKAFSVSIVSRISADTQFSAFYKFAFVI